MLSVSYINSVQTWYFTMRYVSWQDGGVFSPLSFSSVTPPPPPFATHSCRLCFEKVSSKVKIIWKWIWTKYELNNSALLIGKRRGIRHKVVFIPSVWHLHRVVRSPELMQRHYGGVHMTSGVNDELTFSTANILTDCQTQVELITLWRRN